MPIANPLRNKIIIKKKYIITNHSLHPFLLFVYMLRMLSTFYISLFQICSTSIDQAIMLMLFTLTFRSHVFILSFILQALLNYTKRLTKALNCLFFSQIFHILLLSYSNRESDYGHKHNDRFPPPANEGARCNCTFFVSKRQIVMQPFILT